MDQIQVNVAAIELFQTVIETTKSVVIGVAGIPKFGGDKELRAWKTARPDRSTDANFFLIGRSGIDESASRFKGGTNRLFDFRPFLALKKRLTQPAGCRHRYSAESLESCIAHFYKPQNCSIA